MILPEISLNQTQNSYMNSFPGINHTIGAKNGEIYDMNNLSSDYYPLLSTRKLRRTLRTLTTPHGLFCADSLYWVDGTTLYKDGTSIGTVTNTDKAFVALGERVVIFPDKKIYQNSTLSDLGASWSGSSITFKDGTYAEESAEANTIEVSGVTWSNYFKVGDAVTITGCTTHTENNKTPIIREIDGDELHFYEGTFTLTGTSYTETGTMKIERVIPDLDYYCADDNRIWGCKDDTIWCCKLGDPTNWNVFDGVSTDAWSVETGTAGDFTGCVSYLGYPIFFKADKIFKVYGSIPTNYEVLASATMGLKDNRSLAIAGEVLYYLSPQGIVAYSGGIPSVISSSLGDDAWSEGIAATDGLKYFISLKSGTTYTLYVYDTQRKLWHKEDNTQIKWSAYKDGVNIIDSSGKHVFFGSSGGTAESAFNSMVEWGSFDWATMDAKHVNRVKLRIQIESGGWIKASVKHDDKPWMEEGKIVATNESVRQISLSIKRCDSYKIKLEGYGQWKIYAMETEYYAGGRR